MSDADTLVKLMLAHGADFDAIPDAIVPTVRRLLFAAMAAARAEQAERDLGAVRSVANRISPDASVNYYEGHKRAVALCLAAIRAQTPPASLNTAPSSD